MGTGPYEPLCDPSGEWLVWDAVRENVAEFDGYVFLGLTPREALRFSTLLNNMIGPSTSGGSRSALHSRREMLVYGRHRAEFSANSGSLSIVRRVQDPCYGREHHPRPARRVRLDTETWNAFGSSVAGNVASKAFQKQ
jgi:hypothetical protein